MKLNKNFIVSLLLLTIISIGAVSATEEISDDVVTIEPIDEAVNPVIEETEPTNQDLETEPTNQDLETEPTNQDLETEPTNQDLETEPTNEIIGDSIGNSSESHISPLWYEYFYGEFWCEDYYGDIYDFSSHYALDGKNAKFMGYIGFYNPKEGKLNIYIDDVKKYSFTIDADWIGSRDWGHHKIEFNLTDLGILDIGKTIVGTQNIKLKFWDKETQVETLLTEKTLTYLNFTLTNGGRSSVSEYEKFNITLKFPKGITGTVTLYEINNKSGFPLSAKIINGTVKFDFSLPEGYYNIFIKMETNKGNMILHDGITVFKNSANITATVSPTKLVVGKNVIVNFKAIDRDDLFIYVDGKKYQFKNISSKKYEIKGLKAGKHTVRVFFKKTTGDDYDDLLAFYSKTFTITVNKSPTKIVAVKKTFKAKIKTKKYTITLKTKAGQIIKKAKVTLRVGKKTYKATTNSKGKATFKITKLKKKGRYTAIIKFAGTKNYKKSSKKVRITVKK